MTDPEHGRLAELRIEQAVDHKRHTIEEQQLLIATAQVHATLALNATLVILADFLRRPDTGPLARAGESSYR